MVFVVLEKQANQERQFHTQNCRKDLINIIILIFVDISFLFQGGGIFFFFFLDTNSREVLEIHFHVAHLLHLFIHLITILGACYVSSASH